MTKKEQDVEVLNIFVKTIDKLKTHKQNYELKVISPEIAMEKVIETLGECDNHLDELLEEIKETMEEE